MLDHRGLKNHINDNDSNNNNGEYLVIGTDGHKVPGMDYYNFGKPGNMSFNCNKPYCRSNRHVKLLKVGCVLE